ncbi:MAG: hypothetical protein HDR26_00210 [Lachnospiraceae bacterium]|nr:hypothetical protein [Lachnospiraceae bacterium]
MRKKQSNWQRIAGLVLAVVLAVSFNPCHVLAAEEAVDFQVYRVTSEQGQNDADLYWTVFGGDENPNAREVHLFDCSIGFGYTSKGMHMEFVTHCSEQADEIGVSDVKIEHKVGIFWFNFANGADASCKDDTYFHGQADYAGVEFGETYRVSCRHYAYIGEKYLYHDSVTSGYKCTY